MNKFDQILVLAPHADDAEVGCGGTIARFLEEGSTIHYMVFSTAAKSLPPEFPEDTLRKEQTAAFLALGFSEDDLDRLNILHFDVRTFPSRRQYILELLILAKLGINPDLVLMPSLNDIHQDHQTVAQEGIRAFKHSTVLGYELPWNNLTFNCQAFVALKFNHTEAKRKAVRCYESQQHRISMSSSHIWSLAEIRGVSAHCEYAEAFEVYRWMI